MALSPEQRSMRATIAALARWKNEDPTENARRGQDGLLAKFEREIDPNNELSPVERRRRAVAARREHMVRLAFTRSTKRSRADDEPAEAGGAAA